MHTTKKHIALLSIVGLACIAFFFIDISFGSVSIPFKDVFQSLTGGEASKSSWQYIIVNYRLPKALTALAAGMALSVSGLLMQTLFRNPLAGPDVLGLSSGASLGVALILLGSGLLPVTLAGYFTSGYGLVLASVLGSFIVLLAVLAVAQKLRDTMALLITGIMFSSFTGAIVGMLSYFSTAQQLQKYTFWALGSLGNLTWQNIAILFFITLFGLILSIICIKPLDALLLGERYANSMGINIKRTRFTIIAATSLLTGCITAFAGPIAFVGLVVPHIARLILKTSSHKILFCGTLLCGMVLMLVCDLLTQLPGNNMVLPVNAVTSLIGAPIVVWLLWRNNRIMN
ncbi:iron chelate uptake ABC transporter family permease subunit [Flavobacterium rhizosphaerae]|uniref:Iron ABC transporter permease n=1 Tax=Flavobacterium rhizosphaerae TaxID=3163298 RepID=A0ABW8YTN8_9FLAO